MIDELVRKNRSCRRFFEHETIGMETLRELVELGRLSASAANRQPLKYVLSCDPERNARIFSHLAWAAYLTDWPGPGPGERPAGYIIILGDTHISKSFGCDHGIAAQSIMLGAAEKGLGGCMIGSISKEGLRSCLGIDARYEPLLVLALGRPRETALIEDVGPDGDTRYWRDPEQIHHVPKRSLENVVLKLDAPPL